MNNVELTPIARWKIIEEDVVVHQNIVGIHTSTVRGMNVLQTATVQQLLPAAMKNVSILVIVLKMQIAVQGITEVHVPAEKATQEIHMGIDARSVS